MRRLTLICHAATKSQRDGRFPLPDEPILVGAQLRHPDMGRSGQFLSAPEKRAEETARLFAPETRMAEALRDCDWGAWIGKTLKEIHDSDPEGAAAWLADPHVRPHGGETLAELSQRIGQWLDDYAHSGHVLAVTHAAVMRVAALHILQAPFTAFWRMDIQPLSVIDLSSNNQLWTLRALNVPL